MKVFEKTNKQGLMTKYTGQFSSCGVLPLCWGFLEGRRGKDGFRFRTIGLSYTVRWKALGDCQCGVTVSVLNWAVGRQYLFTRSYTASEALPYR